MDEPGTNPSASSNPQEYNFFGGFTHSIDEKGRIIIPTAYRAALGETFSIGPTRLVNGVALYPNAVFDQIVAELNSLNPRNPAVTDYKDMFFSLSMRDMQKDAQGRILLPQNIRQTFLDNAQEVKITGSFNYIRIMDAAKAEANKEKFFANLPNILQQLGNCDL